MRYFGDSRYDDNIINQIHKIEQWYGSLAMGIVIFAIAIYAIIRKRWQRFELTIIFYMFIKYVLYAYVMTDAYKRYFDYINNGGSNYKPYYALWTILYTLGPIYHFIYAS